LLIERELTAALGFLGHRPIDEENLGLEEIEEVGFGFDRGFLEREHTAGWFRRESWLPEFYGRNGWTPEEDRAVIDRATRKVKELVAGHRKPDGREDRLAAARKVLDRARRELVVA
jgi:trimethylamine:corrinoid methyltransferase-like protein